MVVEHPLAVFRRADLEPSPGALEERQADDRQDPSQGLGHPSRSGGCQGLRPAGGHLRAALRLWRGPALAGVPSRIVQAATVRLEEARLCALEEQVRLDLVLGRHQEVIGEIVALAAAEPFREKVQAYLMLALSRSGRRAEALEVYRRTRTAFIEELGIEPSQDLQHVHSDILTHDPHLGLPAAGGQVVKLRPPAQAEPASTSQQSPSEISEFVGREKKTAQTGDFIPQAPHRGRPLAPHMAAVTGPDGTARLPSTFGMAGQVHVDEATFALDEELKTFMSLNDKVSRSKSWRTLGT